MCEGAPEYRATEGPATPAGSDALDQLDDAANAAFDELLDEARELRQHICPDEPRHVDVSSEFLDAAEAFARAFDAFEAAHGSAELAASAERARELSLEDLQGPTAEEKARLTGLRLIGSDEVRWNLWCAAFNAGATTQRKEIMAFAQRRGWVSVSSAVETIPLSKPPSREEVAKVWSGWWPSRVHGRGLNVQA